MGKRRDYLLLTHEHFDDYLMCVGARDYGTNFDVSWFPGIAKDDRRCARW
jgi:hypothetical protein